MSEAYLLTQLERGFRTLDFYKQMTLPAGPDGASPAWRGKDEKLT